MVIWLWFKVENVCDISVLMYNLLHCSLEQFYSLVVKNPNSLFTVFTCLFGGKMNHHSHSMSQISLVEKNQGPRVLFCFVFTIRRQFLFMHHCHLSDRFFRFFFMVLLYPLNQVTCRPIGTPKRKVLFTFRL